MVTVEHRTINFKESLFFVVRSTNPPWGWGGVWLPLKLLGLLAISLKLLDFREKTDFKRRRRFLGDFSKSTSISINKNRHTFSKRACGGH